MDSYIHILILVVIGILLLWIGFTLFFGGRRGEAGARRDRGRDSKDWDRDGGSGDRDTFAGKDRRGRAAQESIEEGIAGNPQVCPICSAKLPKGELVKSSAFPSLNGTDRLMHIRGCVYCIEGKRPRRCPVCGAALRDDEYLISRIFERPGRSHVHVIGCNRCRGLHAVR
ncbi:hypothetical protein FACS189476_06610 [Spirochaetia bacterium]|nr:hypothetical protein FACS189476_06610 [Spirochaetia bacterium]